MCDEIPFKIEKMSDCSGSLTPDRFISRPSLSLLYYRGSNLAQYLNNIALIPDKYKMNTIPIKQMTEVDYWPISIHFEDDF